MKKVFSILVVLLSLTALAACATIRNTPPTLSGYQEVVTITKGDNFNPRAGITARDDKDGDLTENIVIEGFQESWLNTQGNFSYKIYVEDSEGLSAEVTITLIVESNTNNQAPRLIGVHTAQTYYIGSKPYDPIAGVTAMDAEDGDLTDAIVVKGTYSTTRAGRFTITVEVVDSDEAVSSQTISLTVKAAVAIPETLSTAPVTLTIWHSNGSTIENALKQYAASFQVKYPNVTVNVVKNGANYDEMRQNVINAIRGGQLPNIIQGYPDHVMEYIDNNAVIPVTPYIHHPVHGYADTAKDSFWDIQLNYRYENSQYTADGEYYSIPFNKSTEVVIYNKTLFDAMIADGVITEFPKTWQDLIAIAPQIRQRSGAEIDRIMAIYNQSVNTSHHKTPVQVAEIKSKFMPVTYDSESNAFITLIRQWGGLYTGIDNNRQGTILFDNAAARSMLGYFYDNRNNFSVPSIWGTTVNFASDVFKLGQAAVTIGSTGGAYYNSPDKIILADNTPNTLDDNQRAYPFEVGVVPMLYNKDMPQNAAAIQQGTNFSLANIGTDQQKLWSWYFLKHMSSYDVQLDFVQKTGYQPVRTSVYSDPGYVRFMDGKGLNQQGVEFNLEGQDLVRSLASRAAALQANLLFYDQAFVGSSKTREAVGITFERVILSTSSERTKEIDDAIAYAVAEANRVLGK